MKRPSPTIERTLAGVGLTGAFLFMASVFVPQPKASTAVPETGRAATSSDTNASSLGWIEDDFYRAEIIGGPTGPLYTVYDHDGRELGTLMTAEEVTRSFPNLPVESMEFGARGAIMLAEPPQLDW